MRYGNDRDCTERGMMKFYKTAIVFTLMLVSACSSPQEEVVEAVALEAVVVEQVVPSAQTKPSVELSLIEQTIADPYVYMNEVQVKSKQSGVDEKILRAIQALSENVSITSIDPVSRLQEKKALFESCSDMQCGYVPESYKILSQKGHLVNIEYGYNEFSSMDEWFKYAVFDLRAAKRTSYSSLFNDPESVLALFESRYIAQTQRYIDRNPRETGDQEEEFFLYIEHLEIREPFVLADLNNLELIYGDSDQLSSVRFHYQGKGGNYRQTFPNDYIEIQRADLQPYFKMMLK